MLRSIRGRLLLVFIALAVVPLIAVGTLLGIQSFTTQQQEAFLLQHEIASHVSSQVDEIMQQFERDLRAAIQIRGFKGLDSNQQRTVLGALMAFQPAFQELALLDNTGQELARVSRSGFVATSDLVSRSKADEYTLPASTGKTYYSAVSLDQTTGEPLMRLGMPIIDMQSGTTDQVLVANIRFKPVWDLLASISTAQDYSVYIVDSEGRVIAHQNPSFVLKGTTVTVPDQDSIRTGLNGTQDVSAISTLRFGQQVYTIVAERPTSDALALAINTVIVAVVLILVALFVANGIGYVMVRRITQPIQALASTAQAITGGDLSRRAEVTSTDEIGSLATAFNTMTSRLVQNIAELDRRVASRTRDLQVAAEVSHQVTTVLDTKTLLPQLVELSKKAFNLYHTSVFLYNPQTQALKLAASSGDIGAKLLEQGVPVHLNDRPGLIPLAVRNRKAAVTNDTAASPDYKAHILLPATRSEVALPMIFGDKVVGVLDLQSEQTNRFSSNDTEVFATFANQIAVAIRNAELFEQVQAAREQAEQADKVKSTFLASMSHELRTPLNAIINFTRFVAKGSLGPVNQQQVDTLNEVVDSSKHLLNLINDVLDMSKIQAGSLRLFIEDNVSLPTILDSVIATAKSLIADKPVELRTEIATDLPPARVDRQRILQVMLNIISNACKFTEEGYVKVCARQDKDELLLSVEDTGPGIAPEDHDAVFEAFKQTTTGLRQAGGTGLGMPISRSLMQAHGGRLWFESTPGKGTTFYIALPVKSETLVPSVMN